MTFSLPDHPTRFPMGDRGWLVEWPDAEQRRAGWARLEAELADWLAPTGPVELVAGERTVAVLLDPTRAGSLTVEQLQRRLDQEFARPVTAASGIATERPVVPIEVVYDGPDLPALAAAWGWSVAELVGWHSGQLWRVEFTGFMPGFGYLTGERPRQVPRLPVSRPRIEAGSVGLAGRYSGIYPQASPGGWQLIGRTGAELWRTDRTPPALLLTDARVQFIPVGGLADG